MKQLPSWTDLSHVLLGSVAERMVRHAPCPALVVGKNGLLHSHTSGPSAVASGTIQV